MIAGQEQPPVAAPKRLASVAQMFEGKSVFITGASGFIGRVLLEKLLRTYQGINKIYILMRVKKNIQPYDRLHNQLLNVPIFDQIRSMKNCDHLLSKIVVIPGDIAEPNLGISQDNMQMMLEDPTLAVVFHSAATIKFDEPLKVSVQLNLIATRTIIGFCRKLPNLLGLCHVSTAYVNSDMRDNQIIEEKMYPMRENPEQVIKLSELMDENLMQTLKVKLVDQRPNTYTYTKALAEHLIALEASDLPVAIVRPSIVVASWKEPIKGWIDNLNGPTGLILAIGKGLLRSMHANRDCKADIIPVDVVVNTMIASAYYAANTSTRNQETVQISEQLKLKRELVSVSASANGASNNNNHLAAFANGKRLEVISESVGREDDKLGGGGGGGGELTEPRQANGHTNKRIKCNGTASSADMADGAGSGEHKSTDQRENKVPIFHCNSGDIRPITWGAMEDMFFPVIRKYPSCMVLRYPYGTFKSNKYHDFITRLFVHYLPALLIDLMCIASGRKNLLGGKESNWQLLSVYGKLHSATAALTHFCTTNYNFESKNWKKLSSMLETKEDRRQLYMDIDRLDWLEFWDGYVLGARRYVLKEADDTLPRAQQSFKRAFYVEMILRSLVGLLIGYLFLPSLLRVVATSATYYNHLKTSLL